MVRERLIRNGYPQFGFFPDGIAEVNAWDFIPTTVMGKPRGWLARKMGWNQFHFVGVLSPDLILGCAVVDLKWVGNAFAYVYLPGSQELFSWSWLQPLSRKTVIPATPDQGVSSSKSGMQSLEIEALPTGRRVKALLSQKQGFDLEIATPAGFRPLCLCSRAGYTGWVYTQKAAGLPVAGCVRVNGREYALSNAFGGYDWSAGFMRRDTFWNWASLSGCTATGQVIGLNLAAGVNETGFTENGFWIDGLFQKVDTIDFTYDQTNLQRPWKIRSFDGRVDLRFQPQGQRREKKNFLILASNFTQLFGQFSGTLRPATGPEVVINNLFGFAEDHFARW